MKRTVRRKTAASTLILLLASLLMTFPAQAAHYPTFAYTNAPLLQQKTGIIAAPAPVCRPSTAMVRACPSPAL